MKSLTLLLLVLVSSQFSNATSIRCDMRGELRDDLRMGRFSTSPNANSERDFKSVAQMITREFSSDFRRRGKNLKVVQDWLTNEENAFASEDGNTAMIHLLGGYARVMTEDAFLLVACHETGHHLGGAPLYSNSTMSTEGQSDYFATSKCMRRVLKNQDNEAHIKRYGAHYSVRIDCNRVWGTNTKESFLCMRSIMAAMNLRLRFFPNRRDLLTQKDYTKVGATMERHPAPQCRFDTHRAGALCPVSENEMTNGRNTPNCMVGRVREGSGSRPNCWFYN
jgi:hypothetical protein